MLAILRYTRAVHCETQRTSASPFSTSGLDSRTRSTRVFAFVALFERRPRTRVRLLAHCESKTTSSARSIEPCWSPQAEDRPLMKE